MELLQPLFAVGFVLSALGGMLYWLRRKGFAQFAVKGVGRRAGRQIESIERLPLTPQHSLHLIRVADRLLLIAVSPGGCSILDGSGWKMPAENEVVAR